MIEKRRSERKKKSKQRILSHLLLLTGFFLIILMLINSMGVITTTDPNNPFQEGFSTFIQRIGFLFLCIGLIGGFLPKKQFIVSIIAFFIIFSFGELLLFSSLVIHYSVFEILLLILILNFVFLLCLILGLLIYFPFIWIPLNFYLKPYIETIVLKRESANISGLEPTQAISYPPKEVGLSTETSSHLKEGLDSALYTIEISKGWRSGYVLGPPIELIVRDHREQVIFTLKKTSRVKTNYKIYNAQNVELAELIGGMQQKSMTIKEIETNLLTEILPTWRKKGEGRYNLNITTPSGRYFSSNRMISDQSFIVNISDSQAQQVLSLERPRQSGKGCLWGIIRNLGNLDPLLACGIGVSLYLFSVFTMNDPDVELLDKSTEVKIERKRSFKGSVFVFRDKNGIEMFRGKRSGIFKSGFVFTDPSGEMIGELSQKRRSEWVITDSQHGIIGILNLKTSRKDRYNHLSGDSPPFTLVVGNETFSFGTFMGFNRELYDRNGKLSYAIFGYNKLFTLDIKTNLTPNYWCFLSVCLIYEFFIPKDTGGPN